MRSRNIIGGGGGGDRGGGGGSGGGGVGGGVSVSMIIGMVPMVALISDWSPARVTALCPGAGRAGPEIRGLRHLLSWGCFRQPGE